MPIKAADAGRARFGAGCAGITAEGIGGHQGPAHPELPRQPVRQERAVRRAGGPHPGRSQQASAGQVEVDPGAEADHRRPGGRAVPVPERAGGHGGNCSPPL